VFTLHEPGALARQLVGDAHASTLSRTWATWVAELPSL
jgi:urease accessory protein